MHSGSGVEATKRAQKRRRLGWVAPEKNRSLKKGHVGCSTGEEVFGEFFEGVGEDLGEGGVVPRGAEEVVHGGVHRKRAAEAVDELGGGDADDLGAENAAANGVGEDFDVPAFGCHENGFAVVVEGVGGDEEGGITGGEIGFEAADGGEGGIGEDDVQEKVVIDWFKTFRAEGVAGGELALGDGKVDNVVRSGDIAAGVDVFLRGLLPAVDGDTAGGGHVDAGGGEIKVGEVGLAAESVEQVGGTASEAFAGAGEGDGDLAGGVGRDLLEGGVGMELDAFVAEGLLHDLAGGGGVVFEDIGAALDEDDAGADAAEELGELASHDAAAENDDAGRDEMEIEHVVASPEGGPSEAGDRRDGGAGAGGDEESGAAHASAVVEFNLLRGDKAGHGADNGVAFLRHGLLPVGGELADDGELASVEFFHVYGGSGDAKAEPGAVLGEVEDFGRVEQGFRRHAAAQDAEAAELAGAVDDGDRFTEVGGDAGGVEAGGTAADDDKIKGLRHGGKWVA